MIFAYNFLLRIYYSIILLLSIKKIKAKNWLIGRKNWQNMLIKVRKENEDWIWFHCSSLGEYEDCSEIFIQLKNENPLKKTILTVFSPSAFDVLKHTNQFNHIAYLPLDTKRNAKKFIDIIRPCFAVFGRSELWYNYLNETKTRKVPLFLISLKINEKSSFVKWPFNYFYKKCFSCFNHIYCQNEKTKTILNKKFNFNYTTVTGNTRFERIYRQSLLNISFPEIEKFVSNSFVIIFGSALTIEEKSFLEIYKLPEFSSIKWIIVPHEIQQSRVIKLANTNFIKLTEIKKIKNSQKVLIIDSVGKLKHIYKYANFAIIGGGFNKIGIHNIIEPAIFGIKSAFGPNHKNYDEALDLMKLGGAITYQDTNQLIDLVRKEITKTKNENLENKIKAYVKENTCDSSVIVKLIRSQTLI
jgi:3-deoxy-D-manno-octulosonic-acid transferase